MTTSGWIGVDLDGTLAEYHGWDEGKIGAPIPGMVARTKKWLEDGVTVKIFTSRVSFSDVVSPESGALGDPRFVDEQRRLIENWCLEHVGQVLEVTCIKDYACVQIWDDRAFGVEFNGGFSLAGYYLSLLMKVSEAAHANTPLAMELLMEKIEKELERVRPDPAK